MKDENLEHLISEENSPTKVNEALPQPVEAKSEGHIFQSAESFLKHEETNLHSCSGIEGDMIEIANKFEEEFYSNSKPCYEILTSPLLQSKPLLQDTTNSNPASSFKVENPHLQFSNSANKVRVESLYAVEPGTESQKICDDSFSSLSFSESDNVIRFTTASRKSLQSSSESLRKAKLLLENLDKSEEPITSTNFLPSANMRQPTGFKTASNKPISMSNKSLERANSIFNSLENGDASHKQSYLHHLEILSSQKVEACPTSSTICSHQSFPLGFKTASNKSMTISTAAWKKGQSFMQSVEEANLRSLQTLTPSKGGEATFRSQIFSETNKQLYANLRHLNANGIENECKNKRLSLPCSNVSSSPMFKPTNAKRRNSFYKPPRKKPPLTDVDANVPSNSKLHSDTRSSQLKQVFNETLPAGKKQLGVRHDQENQIFVSDESLLKAMALFEQV